MASNGPSTTRARTFGRVPRAAVAGALAAALLAACAVPLFGEQVTGRGHLSGRGSGTARLEGSGTFYMRGCGTLTVRDSAEEADVEISGFVYSRKLPCGLRVYRGTGWVRVNSPDIMVRLDGDIDEIRVRGGGACYLRGEGRYRIRSRTRLWRPGGVYIHFDLTG
jgi:hypothetical protein